MAVMARQLRPGQLQTGSLYNISSSYAVTASYSLNAGTSIDTGAFATTGSNVFIGNQKISGSLYISGSEISFTPNTFNVKTSDGSYTLLQIDNTGVNIDDTVGNSSVDAENRQLYASNGSTIVIDWDARQLLDTNGVTVDWESNQLISTGNRISIDWENRELVASNGLTHILNWNNTASAFFSGSVYGTSSWARNAQTASYYQETDPLFTSVSGSYTTTSSFTQFTSSIQQQVNSLTAATSSYVLASQTSSMAVLSSSFAATASYYAETDPVFTAVSGTFTTTSSFNAFTASYNTASFSGSFTGNLIGTASWAQNALTASYSQTASYVNPLQQNVQLTGSLYLSTPGVASIYFTGSGIPGQLTWNDTDGTLELGLKGGVVKSELGQGLVTRVVNKTVPNVDLSGSNYQVVVVAGAQGQRLAVKLAQADNDANSAGTLGIVAENINKNQEGFIVTVGLLKNRNTTGALQGETWNDGDVLYLSPTTAGAITNVKPQAPQHTVIVGYVEYAHANNGKIYVKIDNGYEIDELHNVRITTASLDVGQLLVRSGSVWINTKQLTGSYSITGSLQATSLTGSLLGTASYYQETDPVFVAKSASLATTGSNLFIGSQIINGALQLNPTQDPGGSNTTSSFFFVTSSGDNTEFNLHYRNNGALWETHWLEERTDTGLVWGGVLTFTNTTMSITPGAGIIINHNANTGSHGDTIPTYVEFGPITASATFITSSQVTYLLIDENGNLVQQTSPFTPQQYNEKFPLGYIFCLTTSSISSFADARVTTYGQDEQQSQFIRAFGPLKISGYDITPQTGSLKITIASGRAYRAGGFYTQNPENPSIYDSVTVPTGSLVRVYRDPSAVGGFKATLNGLVPFTDIDPTKWDDGSGTLQTVASNQWTIQRVFQGVINNISYVYYGQNTYDSLNAAVQSITTEAFEESSTSIIALPFIGYVIARGNATDLGDTTNNKIINSGLFRNTAGASGGGGVATTNLNDLSDVTITSPVNGQALVYSAGSWINSTPTSASYSNTASYVETAQTASYVLQAISSSYASTASFVLQSVSSSFASTASYVQTAQTASYVLHAVSASYAPDTTFPYTGSAIVSGSLLVTGSFSVLDVDGFNNINSAVRSLYGGTGTLSVDWTNRLLSNASGVTVVDWRNNRLIDTSTTRSIDWQNRTLLDTTQATVFNWSNGQALWSTRLSLDWQDRKLYDTSPILSADWSTRTLHDTSTIQSVDWQNRYALDVSGILATNWDARRHYDTSTLTSINWGTRTLNDSSELTSVDWANRQTVDGASVLSLDWASRILYDTSGTSAVDWVQRALVDSISTSAISWDAVNLSYNVIYTVPQLTQLTSATLDAFSIQTGYNNGITQNYSGEQISALGFLDAGVTIGNLVYLNSDGFWYKTDQTSVSSSYMLGVCVENTAGKEAILIEGNVGFTTSSVAGSPLVTGTNFYGVPIYISGSNGAMSTEKPTSGVIRIVGHAFYNSVTTPTNWLMKFRPSNDWYEI